MAPFGTIYSLIKPVLHPRTRLALAVAAIGGHDISTPDDFKFGRDNKTTEYLAKFPLGKIPAFEGADNFLLVESNAIALYLADTVPKPGKREELLGATAHERALVQQWLWFTYQHLEPALTKLCLWRFGPWASYNAAEEEKAEPDLRRWLEYLEASIQAVEAKGVWLAGTKAPSVADLAVCGHLYSGFMIYIDAEMRKEYPVTVSYYKRLLSEAPEINPFYDLEGKWVEARKQPDAAA